MDWSHWVHRHGEQEVSAASQTDRNWYVSCPGPPRWSFPNTRTQNPQGNSARENLRYIFAHRPGFSGPTHVISQRKLSTPPDIGSQKILGSLRKSRPSAAAPALNSSVPVTRAPLETVSPDDCDLGLLLQRLPPLPYGVPPPPAASSNRSGIARGSTLIVAYSPC